MHFSKKIFLIGLFTAHLISCQSSTSKQNTQGNFYTPRYAKGFCIDTINGVKTLSVFNPFQNSQEVSYRYEVGNAPQRVICMSTTHVAMLNFIEKSDCIVGVSGAGYLYDSTLRAAYNSGKISDVGYENSLNMEKILALQPDIIFAYGIAGEFSSIAAKLDEMGLRVVYLGEYTEEHPLGKTEWAVALSSFFGCEQAAIEKFMQVANEYESVQKLASTTDKVKVLLNAPWNDSWFVPGGQGNVATLLRDAGGQSVIALRNHRDSYPISIERAFGSAQNAEVWLNPGQANNLNELHAMHKLIEKIPAFEHSEVYNSNARLSPHGGSDFFESGAVNPHIILKDLIKILHPELLPEHELFYYQKLK